MATPKNYDPGRIVLVVNATQIQGYAPDTFVKASRNVPTVTAKAGCDGQVVRTKSRNRMGKVVITLLASSSSNEVLAAFLAADENGDGSPSAAVGPLMIKDLNGTTLCSAANAWVTQPSDVEYGAESGNREWTLECDELKMHVGGNVI